jgi:hypothetical protein
MPAHTGHGMDREPRDEARPVPDSCSSVKPLRLPSSVGDPIRAAGRSSTDAQVGRARSGYLRPVRDSERGPTQLVRLVVGEDPTAQRDDLVRPARYVPTMTTKPRTPRPSPAAGDAGGTAPTSRCPSPPSDTTQDTPVRSGSKPFPAAEPTGVASRPSNTRSARCSCRPGTPGHCRASSRHGSSPLLARRAATVPPCGSARRSPTRTTRAGRASLTRCSATVTSTWFSCSDGRPISR